MITVFTPAYNRAKTLPRLFESLLAQTDKRFEWLIIDDGSVDETKELVDQFIAEGSLSIRYLYKENGGVNSAMNYGVLHTENEIFYRVDSDDYLKDIAIERIYANWHLVENDDSLCGLILLPIGTDGKSVGIHPFDEIRRVSFFDYYFQYGASGDRATVMKTSVMKQYLFPTFSGEKFCPEGLMWNRMAQKYDVVSIPEIIYVREVEIGDSITSKVVETLENNNVGTITYYSELLKIGQTHDIRLFYYMKSALLYWRFALCNKTLSFCEKVKFVPASAILALIPGVFLLLWDRITRNKRF